MDNIEEKNIKNLRKLDRAISEYAAFSQKLPGAIVADKTIQLFFGQKSGGAGFDGLYQQMRDARPAEGKPTQTAHRLFSAHGGLKVGDWAQKQAYLNMGGAAYAFFAIDSTGGKVRQVRRVNFSANGKKVLSTTTKAGKKARPALFNSAAEAAAEPLTAQARKYGYRLLTRPAARAAYELLNRERARGFSAAQIVFGGILGKLKRLRNLNRSASAPDALLAAAQKNNAGKYISRLTVETTKQSAIMRFDVLDNDVYTKPVGSAALERVCASIVADMDTYVSRKMLEAMK